MRDSSQPANVFLSFRAHAEQKADRRFLRIRKQGVVSELTFSQMLRLAEAYNFVFRAQGLPPPVPSSQSFLTMAKIFTRHSLAR